MTLPFTSRGASLLVVGLAGVVAGWALGYEELVVLGIAAIAAVLLSMVWLLQRPRVDIERELYPDRVSAGEPSFGRVKVRNLASRTSSPFVAQERFGDTPLAVEVPRLPAGERVSQLYRLPTAKRGVVAVGPMRIGRADPLGLVNSQQDHGDVLTLWVHPRHAAVAPLPTKLTRSLEGPSSDTSPQGSATFHAVREYVLGDDLRKVHWRSTARTGTLMVRQYVDTSLPDVTVAVDTTADPSGAGGGDDLLEVRLEVAASIALGSITRHFPLRLVGTGGLDVSSRGGGETARDLLDTLAVLEPDDGSMAEVLRSMGRAHGGAGLVVVTSSPPPGVIDALAGMPRRFGRVTLVDVRRSEGPGGMSVAPVAIRGVQVVTVPDLRTFASAWRRLVAG